MQQTKRVGLFGGIRTSSYSLVRVPEFAAFVTLVLICIVFTAASSKFFTPMSLTSMFTLAAELGTIAVGVSFLMISGDFDLSVGSVFGMSAFLLATISNTGVSPTIAFVSTLIIAMVMGLLNGVVTVRFKIPSFITTLGTMMLWRGVLLYITAGFPIVYKADRTLIDFLGGNIALMLRASAVWFILLTIIFTVVLQRTIYGNWTFATGGDIQAARAAGVPINKVRIINFMICSLLAALAGMVNMARFNIAQTMLGEGKELEAIAAAVIGGNLLMGGYGSIIGTFVGSIILSVISTGLIMMGVPPYLYMGFTGIVVIVAVIVNTSIKGRGGS